MAWRLELPVAMWRVQYQLLGGQRRTLTVVIVSAAALAIGLISARRMLGGQFAGVAVAVLSTLGGIQAALLVLGGCGAIHRAVLRDHQSGMIESHRLSPMTNLSVVLGYLFGATLHVMTLVTMVALAGVAVSFVAGVPSTSWIYGNLFLFNGAVTLWAATLLLSVRQGKPVNPAGVLMVIAAMGILIVWVPGIALFLNVYSVMLGFVMLVPGLRVPPPAALVVVGAVNVAFTAFWLSAAAVKYRRPDLPALNGGRGLALLLLGLLVATGGLEAYTRIDLTRWTSFPDKDFAALQWISTMLGTLILAGVAVAGSVRCRVLGTSGTALRGWADRLSPLLVAVVAATLIFVIMAALGRSFWETLAVAARPRDGGASLASRAWWLTAAACLLATVSLRSVLLAGQRLLKSPGRIVGFFVPVAWLGPPLADHIRAQMMSAGWKELEFSWLMNCSPIGTMIVAWAPFSVRLLPGLLIQVGIMVALELAAWRLRPRTRGTQ